MASRTRTWSDVFRRYLKKNDIRQLDVAFALRVGPSQVSYWCRGSVPREDTRRTIERWSKGAVPADLAA
jgi:transcriptional regulator with XRE-family HTH domain